MLMLLTRWLSQAIVFSYMLLVLVCAVAVTSKIIRVVF